MKRILIAGFGLLAIAGLVGTADAADMGRRPQQMAPVPVMAPVLNWTGPYVGINGGWGWGSSRWGNTGAFDVNGGLLGVTAGYNWQANQAVFGIEADLAWTDIDGRTRAGCAGVCTTSNSWLGTVRGRLGFAADRFMPYVTGGAAFGDIAARRTAFAGTTSTEAGWTLGAGVEAVIAPNWSVKGEYLYVDLGRFNCGTNCGAAAVNNVGFTTNLVRAGVNYKF